MTLFLQKWPLLWSLVLPNFKSHLKVSSPPTSQFIAILCNHSLCSLYSIHKFWNLHYSLHRFLTLIIQIGKFSNEGCSYLWAMWGMLSKRYSVCKCKMWHYFSKSDHHYEAIKKKKKKKRKNVSDALSRRLFSSLTPCLHKKFWLDQHNLS